MLRREVLKSLVALAAVPSLAFADEAAVVGLAFGDPEPFSQDSLIEMARTLAGGPFALRPTYPDPWVNLDANVFKSLKFDARNALFEGTDTPLRVDAFPPGPYFNRAVKISVVQGGLARPVLFDLAAFEKSADFPDLPGDPTLGYSGLSLRAETAGSGNFQDFAVFRGASYFRGIGWGQTYGLQARGLALNTGEPQGEEFPDFVSFWVERPAPDQTDVVVYALLDSPSCAGAYRFRMQPGKTLVMEVDAHIFARTEMPHVGLAPLTSMFLFDETMRDRFSDYRPAVHDSDGLLISNGAGETIWRPLSNPQTLQVSSFVDFGPKGFGLMQRSRRFSDFADLNARYDRRPSLWVEPDGDWGAGAVTLVEIPSNREIYDNIVAYWRPKEPYAKGSETHLTYRLLWGDEPALPNSPLRVLKTLMGGRPDEGVVTAIDFENSPDVPEDLSKIEMVVNTSVGEVSDAILETNPGTGGPRLAFTFHPGTEAQAEFRVQLRLNGAPLSELWLYRWTK